MKRRGALLLLAVALPLSACGRSGEAPMSPEGEARALNRAEAMLTERPDTERTPDTEQTKGPARQ